MHGSVRGSPSRRLWGAVKKSKQRRTNNLMAAPGQMRIETIEVQASTVPVRPQRLRRIEKRNATFSGDALQDPIRCVEIDLLGFYLDGIVFDSPLPVVLIDLLNFAEHRSEKSTESRRSMA